MRKWLVVIGVEIILLAGPFMVNQEWFMKNAPKLLALGALVFLFGFLWDHLPRGYTFVKNHNWLKLEPSARHFRDLLGEPTEGSAAEMFDRLVRDSLAKKPLESVFLSWLEDGIDRGQIQAWGRPTNGSKMILIRPPTSERLNEDRDSLTIFSNGQQFHDIEVRRSSLSSYVMWMEQAESNP